MRFAVLIIWLGLTACSPTLDNGDLGNVRYFGLIPGEAPMRLLPPVTDRNGNIYVAYGDRERSDTEVWVGRHSGGWKNACKLHRGDFGVHGFVGMSDNDAWLWTGDAIVHIWGDSGTCHEVLDNDPVTGTLLKWKAVAPWVRISPSRATTVAIVRATAEDENYVVLLDMQREIMTNLSRLTPIGLTDLKILGTGADERIDEILFAVSYNWEGQQIHEGLIFDSNAALKRRIPLDLDVSPDEYAVLGFFQSNGGGAWAGVRDDGGLILLDENSGYDTTPEFDALGLLRTDTSLFVTGLLGSTSVAAKLANNSGLNGAREWDSPMKAQSKLQPPMTIYDERNSPVTKTSWSTVKNAINVLPLISPHPLDSYTTQSTGWLLAGPAYSGPAEDITSVGFVPIGWESP